MIRVLLCDDHPIVRTGIRALLETEEGIVVVGEAGTYDEAVAQAVSGACDVVLLDLQFREARNGVDATRAIKAAANPPSVLIFTNYDTDADLFGAIEAGADGYLLKDAGPDTILTAVRQAAAGHSALGPDVTAKLMSRLRTGQVKLTARELEVLRLVDRGLSNAQIAAALVLSEKTVKSHLANIFTKLDVPSRSAATRRARESGLIR